MKLVFFTIGAFFTILIIIIGFENFKTFTNIPYYILVWDYNLPIMYPIFISAIMGGIAGAAFTHGMHVMISEKNNEDGDDY